MSLLSTAVKKNLCDASNMALIKPMLKIMYFFIVNNTNVFFRACMLKKYFVYVKKKKEVTQFFFCKLCPEINEHSLYIFCIMYIFFYYNQ